MIAARSAASSSFAASDDVLFTAKENPRAESQRNRWRHLLQSLGNPVRLAAREIDRVIDRAPGRRHHADFAGRWVHLDDQTARPRIELDRNRHGLAIYAQQCARCGLRPRRRTGMDPLAHGLFFTRRACFSLSNTLAGASLSHANATTP